MTNGLRRRGQGIAGAAAALALLALLATACGGGGTVGGSAVPPVAPAGRPIVYVAVGASDSVGIGASDPVTQAWPQVFYRTALPRAAVFFDLGIPGATVAEALGEEAPEALGLHPAAPGGGWLQPVDIVGVDGHPERLSLAGPGGKKPLPQYLSMSL